MEVIEIIRHLRENDFEVEVDGRDLELWPVEKVTDDLIQRLRENKPEDKKPSHWRWPFESDYRLVKIIYK